MKKILKTFVNFQALLPFHIAVPFYLLLVTPLWALATVLKPQIIMAGPFDFKFFVIAVTYLVLPWTICFLCYLRHRAAFFSLAMMSAGLIFHTSQLSGYPDSAIKVVHYGVIGLMLMMGFFLLRKDVVFPFLSKVKRGWRFVPRLRTNYPISIVANGVTRQATVVDVSVSGLGILVHFATNSDPLNLSQNMPALVVTKDPDTTSNEAITIQCEVVWSTVNANHELIGLIVLSQTQQARIIESVLSHGQGKRKFPVVFAKLMLRREALSAWALAIASSIGIPACGEGMNTGAATTSDKRTPAEVASADQTTPAQIANEAVVKDLEKVDSTVTTDHGFKGKPGSTVLTQDGKLEPISKDNPRNRVVSQIYTGETLKKVVCDEGVDSRVAPLVTSYSHVALLNFFAPDNKGQAWFRQYLDSLQQSDALDVVRPKTPAIADVITRLGRGVNAAEYQLTAVRFRFPEDKNQHSQIKLNYTLDVVNSRTVSLESAQFIYAIAIPASLRDQLLIDLAGVPQNASLSGCSLSNLLDKYLPLGQFEFVHSNLFIPDVQSMMSMTAPTPPGWILNEGRPVLDPQNFNQDERSWVANQATYACQNKSIGMDYMYPGMGDSNQEAIDFDSFSDERSCVLALAAYFGHKDGLSRTIVYPDPDEARFIPKGAQLRIVKMAFPQVKPGANNRPVQTGKAVEVWVSSDKGEKSAPLPIAVDEEGNILEPDHPMMAFDDSHSCASCHNRVHGVDVNPETGKLFELPDMKMRHIGFGDSSGLPEFDPMFEVRRSDQYAALSAFLIRTADVGAIYFGGSERLKSIEGRSLDLKKENLTPEETEQFRTLLCGLAGVAKTGDAVCTQKREAFRVWWEQKRRVLVENEVKPAKVESKKHEIYDSCTPFRNCECSAGQEFVSAQLCIHDAILAKLRPDTSLFVDLNAVVDNAKKQKLIPALFELTMLVPGKVISESLASKLGLESNPQPHSSPDFSGTMTFEQLKEMDRIEALKKDIARRQAEYDQQIAALVESQNEKKKTIEETLAAFQVGMMNYYFSDQFYFYDYENSLSAEQRATLQSLADSYNAKQSDLSRLRQEREYLQYELYGP